jgi:hypothetical protein
MISTSLPSNLCNVNIRVFYSGRFCLREFFISESKLAPMFSGNEKLACLTNQLSLSKSVTEVVMNLFPSRLS